jgi:hypothetical protein
MDETALPIVFVDLAFRHGVIDSPGRAAMWPIARRGCSSLGDREH